MSLYLEDKKQDQYNNLANKFHEILVGPESKAKIGADYLSGRGVDRKTIDDFKIGYCPEKVQLPGLLAYMAGRVIFPIFDEYGNVIAFSGRIPKTKEFIKKSESVWFHESFSKTLFPYALNIAWPHIVFRNQVIIVEGQFDVIAMHNAGYLNTVGLLGGSFTEESFAKLSRFTNTFVTMFDGDMAGREAASRAKDVLTEYKGSGYNYNNIQLIFKKDGINKEYDPDEFISEYGRTYMKKVVDKVISFNKNDEIEDILA
jgi:DNA primase